ncbi:hypothetical protein LCGC14_0734010 [marine sediment metagenome]|uniref:Uncharacterized protein n=1 Tax=marine sediment metagenome TaxID=412755 RepID=A0A0F9QCT0_9ZZZZ
MIELVDMVLKSDVRPMDEGGQDIGKAFNVDLVIQSGTGEPVPFAALQAIVCWSRGLEVLAPKGVEIGPYQEWTSMRDGEHFFDDHYIDDLNADMEDGELLYVAMANFNEYPRATVEGLPIHRWTFKPTRMGNHRVWVAAKSGKYTQSYVMGIRAGEHINRQPLVKIYTQTDDPRHRR